MLVDTEMLQVTVAELRALLAVAERRGIQAGAQAGADAVKRYYMQAGADAVRQTYVQQGASAAARSLEEQGRLLSGATEALIRDVERDAAGTVTALVERRIPVRRA